MSEAKKTIISQIKQELRQQSNPQVQASGERFFKEKVKLYGVKTAKVSQIAKSHKQQILVLDKQAVFAYVMQHKAKMPRTALRYAIEKMPKGLKVKAMA